MAQHKLEQVLESHNRPARVVQVQTAPQVIRYRVTPLHRRLASGKESMYLTTVGQLRRLTDDIEAAMGQPTTVTLDGAGLWIELRRGSPVKVWTRNIEPPAKCEYPLLLGMTVSGKGLVLDLVDPNAPAMLIGGTPGSGKSILLHSIIYGLCRWTSPASTRLVLIDTNSPSEQVTTKLTIKENGGLRVWDGCAHVEKVANDSISAMGVLEGINLLLSKRYREGSPPSPRYIIVIDELADLMGDRVYKDEIGKLIGEIAQDGRKKGIHIIAATQRPSVDVIKGMSKASLPVRVAMTTASAMDSRIILDQKGAERLGGRGDGLLRIGMDVTRFQGGLVTDEDVEKVREWSVRWRTATGYYRRPSPKVERKEEGVDSWLARVLGWGGR